MFMFRLGIGDTMQDCCWVCGVVTHADNLIALKDRSGEYRTVCPTTDCATRLLIVEPGEEEE